jgi:hypothetical protein
MNTQDYRNMLIQKARSLYQNYQVLPCGSKKSLDECFTVCGDRCMLWFNTTKDSSTRVVSARLG